MDYALFIINKRNKICLRELVNRHECEGFCSITHFLKLFCKKKNYCFKTLEENSLLLKLVSYLVSIRDEFQLKLVSSRDEFREKIL